MPSAPRSLAAVALCTSLCAAGPHGAGAEGGRLYPSGPPHGVAYLRFANLSPAAVKITSAAAAVDLPADDTHRVGQYDPVTPGTDLSGAVELNGKTEPIKMTLTPNEFLTVAVTAGDGGDPKVALMREKPEDFNAQKSSLVLYNLDGKCAEGSLVAGDAHNAVISGVAPDSLGRRLVNPVDVALAVACGDNGPGIAVKLGQMAAGERYSIFLFLGSGAAPQTLALRDEMAPLRP
jgi:hypothetical protein